MITLTAITKTFNSGKPNAFTALKAINLTLEANRLTVIKGPSGSGKSTLLSIIGAMTRPTEGRVFIEGQEISSLPERFLAEIRRQRFGFVFQGNHLIQGMSVLENIMAPAYPTGSTYRSIRQRADALMERLQIEPKKKQRVELLSGGEQQRTAIARALINDPIHIIADEPTAHLDTDLAREFKRMILELGQKGKSILIASHDALIYEWDQVDRVVELRDGSIIDDGGKPCS